MDVQNNLDDVKEALGQGDVGHARRILKILYKSTYDIILSSMLLNTIKDVNQAKLKTAKQDLNAAEVIDNLHNYSVMM